ncbi:ABC transporter substrate-binding protein [Arthrobacter sulfonylureivorans]|uniref:ABC transporter substrate-binding protein n=1 Tax=Arthrobacter sulfonylureivorans TaxID=2486855 RepID=A0ABY3W5U0_9MICC|nr:ABC transporter substrate-binding protein [Arthrobacter sulfonylureivorans]UNK45639.1 ABC transporter substrate-binding protein [Arthrobacter sulfonylureivorans]
MMTTQARSKAVVRLIAGMSAGLLALGLTACATEANSQTNQGSSSDSDAITVRFQYNVGSSTLPIVVADRLGFWEENGIDFQGTEITPGPAGIAALGSQSDVLQTTQQTLFEAAEKGRDLKIFAGMGLSTTEVPAFPVFTNGDADNFADLTGEVVGVPGLTSFPTTALKYVADKEGGDSSQIEMVVVPWDTQADQLKADRVAAVWSIQPHAINLAKQGYKMLGDPTLLATDRDEMLASVVATTAEYADKNPEALKRIKAALNDAKDWIEGNDAEAKEIMIDWIGLPEELVVGHPLTAVKIDITVEDLEPMKSIYKDLGLFANLPPLEEIYVSTEE